MEDVVRELNPLLWRVARSQGLGAEEATDVVQTAWLELLRRLNDIHSPQALTAWLVTTTRRESWRVRERGRRDRHEESDVMEALPDMGIGPAEQILVDERDASLWRNLEQLPLRCRQLLTVVAQVGRPDYGAIAEALGMPHGSIGPTRGRCLAKLRQLLLADPTWSA